MLQDQPAMATSSLERDIKISYADGMFYSLMVGLGETYLPAFALAIGYSQLQAGLLATVPLVAGGLIQLLTPWLSRNVRGHKSWVVACVALQALTFAPLCFYAVTGWAPLTALFVAAACYWAFGMAAGSVWNNWIDNLLPHERLNSFFSIRSRLLQIAAFAAFLIGGWGLHVFDQHWHNKSAPFAMIFGASLLARLISAIFLTQQNDPPRLLSWSETQGLKGLHSIPKGSKRQHPARQILAHLADPQGGRFLLYISVLTVALNISAPYFTPFMLGLRQYDYAAYAQIAGAVYLAKIMFYPQIARLVHRVGAWRSLIWTGTLVSIPPLLWFRLEAVWMLVALQFIAGLLWGIFELASTLLIFERLRPDLRVSILTYYNLSNALAVAAGAFIGGYFLGGDSPSLAHYAVVFSLSAVARLASLLALIELRHWRHPCKAITEANLFRP